ncbi:MAG: 5'/3'-nucleotidase SurE [Planctomycetota bacterium]|nr:5'/3'-nucleotidase SurE [Planctomycetota bacterium]
MRILLTNDDGIHAPGLKAMRDALLKLGDVQVVAPATQQSGVGLSTTYLHPLFAHEEFRDGEPFGWAVSGTPSDCVKLAMLELCHPRPDIVVSGINAGANFGINVLYSGTVAAAIEAAFQGVMAFAVSHQYSDDFPCRYESAAKQTTEIMRRLLDQHTSASLWNINFPCCEPRGIKSVSIGTKREIDHFEKGRDPHGRTFYWSGPDPIEHHRSDHGTDIRELADGYITVTPLTFDVTDHATLAELQTRSVWP